MATSVPSGRSLAEYFREWSGARFASELELAALAERGLPLTTVSRMTKQGLTRDEVHALVIHRRTFKHRKSSHQKLSREESDGQSDGADSSAGAGYVWGFGGGARMGARAESAV